MPVTAQQRRLVLNQLTSLAAADVRNLWAAAAERLTNVDFAQFIVDAYPDVIAPWASAAADFAATWFEESIPGRPAVTADTAAAARLEGSARWALGADGTQALPRLQSSGQRAVFDGARDTTLLNVVRSNVMWARDARADACAFCRLLATRSKKQLYSPTGVVFDEQLGAFRNKVVGRRGRPTGSQAVGDRYHDDCRCTAVEVPDPDSYTLPEHAQQWQEEYAKARANAGRGDLKAILAEWRKQSADIR